MQILLLCYIFIFGLIIGSFLNCLIWRLHTGEGLWNRSHCCKCNKKIVWYDNIPLISYIILKAKCRNCKTNISMQYPIVEFVTALLFAVSFYFNTNECYELQAMSYMFRDFFVISILIIIFVYDLRWYLILDKITLPAIFIIFISNLILGVSWSGMLLAATVGGGFFLIQFIISNGRWIGGGDIRLGFLLGIILGWPNIIIALIIAYILGSIIGISLIIKQKKEWGSKVPMGIFLTTSAIITLFWGERISNWYFNLLY
ncbi:prepilin peptidase [Candidatus Parcubacteria bacterium]|nr:prepilin peptidase [Candidatus Parcubacteria bacterium]